MLQRSADLRAETIPLFYIGTSIVFLLRAVPVGQLADRFGRARIVLAGHALVAVAYGLLATVNVSPVIILLCLALHGAYYASTDGVLAALSTAASLAKLAGSVCLGAIWNWYGAPRAVAFSLAATSVAVIARLSSVCDEALPSEAS
jgi:hypothetical protein